MLLSQHPQHPSSHGLIQNVQAPDPSCIKGRSTSSDVVRGDQESTASMFHHPTSTSAGDCPQSPASHMDIASGETKENKGAALVMREIQNMEDNRVSTSPKRVGIYVGTNHEAQSLTIPSTVQAHQTPAMDMVDVPSSPPQPHSLNTTDPFPTPTSSLQPMTPVHTSSIPSYSDDGTGSPLHLQHTNTPMGELDPSPTLEDRNDSTLEPSERTLGSILPSVELRHVPQSPPFAVPLAAPPTALDTVSIPLFQYAPAFPPIPFVPVEGGLLLYTPAGYDGSGSYTFPVQPTLSRDTT